MSPRRARSSAHRWNLDYTDCSSNVAHGSQPHRTAAIRAAIDSYTIPPGFPVEVSARDPAALQALFPQKEPKSDATKKEAARAALKAAYQSSWSIAFSPVRTLLTSAFALYMTGNSIQFFSVVSTVTVLFMQLQNLFGVRNAFRSVIKAGVPRRSMIPQALVHFILLCVGVAGGLYKAHLLGILPTSESDWIGLLPPVARKESFLYHSTKIPR